MDWKLHKSGWIEERNFDIEFAETPEGYHARVRVFGFPVLEDTKNVFPNEALAEKGALTLRWSATGSAHQARYAFEPRAQAARTGRE
ncbi:hypothetical protein [Nitrosomonas communis]|uniref:hypothetical protein n=1 Tax=Nitrosomonas communis TaxID=44574 RepID=UPI003D2BFAB7